MVAAVDRAVIDRRPADDATVLRDRFRAAFENAEDDAGGDQQSAQNQRLLQHGRREKVDERRILEGLLQHIHHHHKKDDPEAEPQNCGRHTRKFTVGRSSGSVKLLMDDDMSWQEIDIDRAIPISPPYVDAPRVQRFDNARVRMAERVV